MEFFYPNGKCDVLQRAFYPGFNTQVVEMDAAKGTQLGASLIEDEKMIFARLCISHYIQVLFFAIERGDYPNLVKGYYGMDGNQTELPKLGKESDIFTWGENIKNGEAALIANSYPAMTNPTAAQVAAALLEFNTTHGTQSASVESFDKEQEDVAALIPEAKELVTDIWDEVEFTYRKEDFPSKRANCRLYGVVYSSKSKATITGTVTNASGGAALEAVNVEVTESGESVLTIADGTYSLGTGFFGAVTLEFSLDGFTTQTFPIDVHEGGEITQDVALVAV
ncbi:MAG: carboxypeptidase regulatory-like domain-containing protein [Ignavibacteria bacterium]|nr:carboxypeptidase regulatory-like domain-containing protein [Ignavibacteria bacterium]